MYSTHLTALDLIALEADAALVAVLSYFNWVLAVECAERSCAGNRGQVLDLVGVLDLEGDLSFRQACLFTELECEVTLDWIVDLVRLQFENSFGG